MNILDRFINYVKIDTTSSEESGSHPSSDKQFNLAKLLFAEMQGMGMTDVRLTDKCYLYGKIPATAGCENAPRLGLIAHMDTAPAFSGTGVNPIIHENYDGKALRLGESSLTLDPITFPHLPSLAGRTLITTDGTTLLGADDKAGVAEIMAVAEELIKGDIPHGPISIAFTPDEEIGEGADFFDVEGFGADFAYTLDGGEEGGIEYENFNAAGCDFLIKGVSVHPGDAKGKMINASLVAFEINASLPKNEIPAMTEGYEGFFHLTDMAGDCSKATLSYIVRDHSKKKFEERLETLKGIEKCFKEKYGDDAVSLKIKLQYENMKQKIEPVMHLIENAKEGAARAGITPMTYPIRGGTDGARLSFMGLPCPNLGTGGYAYHGPFEHVTLEGMEKSAVMVLEIIRLYGKMKRG